MATATKKKENDELLPLPGVNLSHNNRVLRAIKMGQPVHAECQWPPRKQWWTFCEEQGHEPYVTKQERLIETPVYAVDEDGDMVLKETKTKLKVVVKPNIVQVPLDPGHNDGRGPEKFAREKGFRQLEDIGYAPLCQLLDCWMPATITCEFGEYCSKEHARLIGAGVEGTPLEVLDGRKRRKQLRGVEID